MRLISLLLLIFSLPLFAAAWLDSNPFMGALGVIAMLVGLMGWFSEE